MLIFFLEIKVQDRSDSFYLFTWNGSFLGLGFGFSWWIVFPWDGCDSLYVFNGSQPFQCLILLGKWKQSLFSFHNKVQA